MVVREDNQNEDGAQRVELSELTSDQLFRRFYERRRGAEPDERLVAMFQRLLAETGGEEEVE